MIFSRFFSSFVVVVFVFVAAFWNLILASLFFSRCVYACNEETAQDKNEFSSYGGAIRIATSDSNSINESTGEQLNAATKVFWEM